MTNEAPREKLDSGMRDHFDDGTIRIRRHTLDDVDALFRASRESIAEVGRFLPWLDDDYVRSDSRAWIEASISAWDAADRFSFVVEELDSGRMLGGVGLNTFDRANRRANLGYWVRSSATGRGVATRAATLAARFGLRDCGFTRIEIVSAVANLASQRVAVKIGAEREGVLRNRIVLRGEIHDAIVFSLIPEWLDA